MATTYYFSPTGRFLDFYRERHGVDPSDLCELDGETELLEQQDNNTKDTGATSVTWKEMRTTAATAFVWTSKYSFLLESGCHGWMIGYRRILSVTVTVSGEEESDENKSRNTTTTLFLWARTAEAACRAAHVLTTILTQTTNVEAVHWKSMTDGDRLVFPVPTRILGAFLSLFTVTGEAVGDRHVTLKSFVLTSSQCQVLTNARAPSSTSTVSLVACRFASAAVFRSFAESLVGNSSGYRFEIHGCSGVDSHTLSVALGSNRVVGLMLQCNTSCRTPFVGDSSSYFYSDRDLAVILESVGRNSSLEVLDVSAQPISACNWQALGTALHCHSSLQVLTATDTLHWNASEKDVEARRVALRRIVEDSTILHTIQMSHSQTVDEEAFERDFLRPRLRRNKCRPRIRQLQRLSAHIRPQIMGQALIYASDDPGLLWFFLTSNVDVLFLH